MPKDSGTVQSDGNYTSTSISGAKVVRYGDYLIVLNSSVSSYSAKLPAGVGLAEDLMTRNTYSLGSTVLVPAGQAAIFWLAASNVIGPIGAGADIGAVGTAGSDAYAGGICTISGAGADIGGTSDAFHFAADSADGDATVSAQVLSQSNTNSAAKAGVMIRDGSAANAAYAAVLRTPSDGILFQWRSTTGGSAAWAAVPTPLTCAWVKLVRSGNDFSAFYSIDGLTWIQIGSTQTILLSSSVEVGLAVTSHNASALSTATFANATINAGAAPTVATPASAVLVSSGSNAYKQANLSVLGADNGGESGLTYTWYLLGDPPDPVTFSGATNGTNAAKNITAAFASNGVYNFRVIIKDSGGAIATNDVSVTVSQILSGVSVSPTTTSLYSSATQQFTATANDQFGMPMANQPAFTWSIYSGVGTVDSFGLYAAPASGSGSATVRATSGSLYGSATVTVVALTPVGVFSNTMAIGSYSPTGSASYSAGTYAVSAAGSDIWGASDQFRFVYMPLTGDGTITARVATEPATNSWTKVGVMFRNTLDAASAYAMSMVTPGNGAGLQYRTTSGGSSVNTMTAGLAAPCWVRVTRMGNSFTAYFSANGTAWTQSGAAQTIVMNNTVYVGLVVCSHASGSLNTSTFDNLSVTQPTHTFPSNQDIGSPAVAGSYSESAGATTLTAQCGDIWYASDQCQFAYIPLNGNVTITARVVSETDTATWAKAGVMIRSSLNANASNVLVAVTPTTTNGVTFQWRPNDGTDQSLGSYYTKVTGTGITVPYWVRIIRNGGSFTAWRSPDGVTWTQIGSAKTITMGPTAYIGLALTSNNTGSTCTAVLDNITITGGTANAAPTVATAAAVSTNPVTGATALLSVLGADSDGGESNLIYTWSTVGPISGNLAFTPTARTPPKTRPLHLPRPASTTSKSRSRTAAD